MIERFKGADKYLFSLPMWNFGVPCKLKKYIDVIVQPTYTASVERVKAEAAARARSAAGAF